MTLRKVSGGGVQPLRETKLGRRCRGPVAEDNQTITMYSSFMGVFLKLIKIYPQFVLCSKPSQHVYEELDEAMKPTDNGMDQEIR